MKKIIFSVFVFFLFLAPFFAVKAQSYGLNETAGYVGAYKDQRAKEYNQNFLATKAGEVIGMILSFVGVIFLALVIYGGITWMTAGGNDQKVEKAKTIIIDATIGLIIVLSAYAITSFIGTQLAQ